MISIQQKFNSSSYSIEDELTSQYTTVCDPKTLNNSTAISANLDTKDEQQIKVRDSAFKISKVKTLKSNSNSRPSSKESLGATQNMQKSSPKYINVQNSQKKPVNDIVQDQMYQTKTNFLNVKTGNRSSKNKDPNYAKPTNASLKARVDTQMNLKKQNADIFMLDPDPRLKHNDGFYVGGHNVVKPYESKSKKLKSQLQADSPK